MHVLEQIRQIVENFQDIDERLRVARAVGEITHDQYRSFRRTAKKMERAFEEGRLEDCLEHADALKQDILDLQDQED
jgi:hypothetical protein